MRKFLISLGVLTSLASANDLDNLLERVQSEPFSMDYELEIYWSVRERTETKEGELLIRGNDEFNFVHDNAHWISDGITLWQYSEDNNQVIIKSFMDLSRSLRPNSIFERFADRDFSETTVTGERVWRWEGDEDPDYIRIEITLSDDGDVFEEIHFVDTENNTSTYEIDNMEFLETVDDSEFIFTIPDGVEVFDER